MKYKLVAIDLDDTLLKDDLTISERVKRQLKHPLIRDFGTFATGRMLPQLYLTLVLNLICLYYLSGALVKYADGREIYHRPLELL